MKKVCVLLWVVCTFMTSCFRSRSDQQVQDVIIIERFDKDFLQYLHSPNRAQKDILIHKYPTLLPAFGQITVNASAVQNADFFNRLNAYFGNGTLRTIYADAEKIFADVSHYEQELTNANHLLNSILPGKKLPRIGMHVSGLQQNAIATDKIISLSIDKYLGEAYPFYQEHFYDYQRSQMAPQYITRDYLRAYILSYLLPEQKDSNLVKTMIREGKRLYLLSMLLPDYKADKLLGYTEEQMQWCRSNERLAWEVTVQRQYLYSTDYLVISKYMDEGSYSALVSHLSPGKIGAWMGLQIVQSFVKNNSSIALPVLLEMDEQKILEQAKYVP